MLPLEDISLQRTRTSDLKTFFVKQNNSRMVEDIIVDQNWPDNCHLLYSHKRRNIELCIRYSTLITKIEY